MVFLWFSYGLPEGTSWVSMAIDPPRRHPGHVALEKSSWRGHHDAQDHFQHKKGLKRWRVWSKLELLVVGKLGCNMFESYIYILYDIYIYVCVCDYICM